MNETDKWLKNNTFVTNDKDRLFFEGYRPSYYFRNTTKEENEAERKALEKLSTPTGIKLFEDELEDKMFEEILKSIDYTNYTSVNSKGFTLEDLNKAMERLEKLPPVPIEIEIGQIAWDILVSQLNIHMVHDSSKISTLFGISIVFYEGDEIKFNQMRVKYNNGDSKVIDVFEYNCNYDFVYKNIFKEED